MTRSRLLALLVLPALSVPVLAGCGAEKLAGVDVARAASATKDKGTARVTMTMTMSGTALPQDITFTAEGVTALDRPRMNLTMDFTKLLSSAGLDGVDGHVEIRLDGANVYVHPPRIQVLGLPEWIGLDLRRVASAMGIDPESASALFTFDPASQLRVMNAAGLKPVGTEEIGGVKTTHLKGVVTREATLAALPPAKRRALRRLLAQAEKLGGARLDDQGTPIELWVGEDMVARRMRTSMDIPSQSGTQPGHADITMELSDFGAPLDVARPDGVVDMTSKLVGAMKGLIPTLKGRGGTSAG